MPGTGIALFRPHPHRIVIPAREPVSRTSYFSFIQNQKRDKTPGFRIRYGMTSKSKAKAESPLPPLRKGGNKIRSKSKALVQHRSWCWRQSSWRWTGKPRFTYQSTIKSGT